MTKNRKCAICALTYLEPFAPGWTHQWLYVKERQERIDFDRCPGCSETARHHSIGKTALGSNDPNGDTA